MNPIEPSEHLLARLNERLTDRELLVMRMRLGFTSQAPMTLQQIGMALGLTRERVRQIQQGKSVQSRVYLGGQRVIKTIECNSLGGLLSLT